MLKDRIDLYKDLESKRQSKLLVYVTSHRQGMETSIAPDVLPWFTEHLDLIGRADKISLILITNGGVTSTAWSLVNLIRNFCDKFEVIIPANCFSSGTLISLGADNLIMTKQATLGPIDPSTNGPFNPVMNGTNQRVSVSVEFVKAYIEMAKNEFGIRSQQYMTEILLKLSDKIHPLALGQVYRSRQQIQMLAKKLMSWQKLSKETEDRIINFLCSESGSHDYAIRRKEARDYLGLNVESPDQDLYKTIKAIYDDISNEFEFTNPYNPEIILGGSANKNYSSRRCIIESLDGGTDVFVSEGTLVRQVVSGPAGNKIVIQDNRSYEGWRHEKQP